MLMYLPPVRALGEPSFVDAVRHDIKSTLPLVLKCYRMMLSLSVITACVPVVKPFLDRLQFRLLDSSIPFHTSAFELYPTAQAGNAQG